MDNRLNTVAHDGGDPRACFGRGCAFALPISLALWGVILFCVEKIF